MESVASGAYKFRQGWVIGAAEQACGLQGFLCTGLDLRDGVSTVCLCWCLTLMVEVPPDWAGRGWLAWLGVGEQTTALVSYVRQWGAE